MRFCGKNCYSTLIITYCVDHDILLRRLRQSFGIGGIALAWIESFLRGRTEQVAYAGSLSAAILLLCGVPHGSVLGQLLFLLYTAELFDIIAGTGLTSHSSRHDMLAIISSRYQYGPFLCFVAEVMSNYLTTDGLKKISLLPEPPPLEA